MRSWLFAGLLLGCGGDPGGGDAGDAAPGPRANYAFATSSVHTGNLGGVAGADAICAERAAAAGLDGTFVARIGGASFDRLNGSRGWTRVDGAPVAVMAADWVSGALLYPVTVDEEGRNVSAGLARTWTGLNADGTLHVDCIDWTSAGTDRGRVGDAGRAGAEFSDSGAVDCNVPARVVCLETGRDVEVAVIPTEGRFAFVSSFWAPAGLASADLACQTDATQAGLPGTYLAALSTSTQAAAARFDLTGPPWVRIDGAALAPTAAQLFSSDALATFANQTADGRVAENQTRWGGDPLVVQAIEMSCADWTSALATSVGHIGRIHATERQAAFRDNTGACDVPRRLLCLQQ